MNIDIVVANKIARAPLDAEIVCGNNDYTVTFDFDSEWDSHPVKTARFIYVKCGRVRYEDVPFEGQTCDVPLLSNITRVDVGVYAGDLRTTTAAMIKCKRSILCDGGVPEEPTEDVYNRLMELINQKVLDPNAPIDQIFDAESKNAQSGKALADVVIKRINADVINIWELEAGLYCILGNPFSSSVRFKTESGSSISLDNEEGCFLFVSAIPFEANTKLFYLFCKNKIYSGWSQSLGDFDGVEMAIGEANEMPTAEALHDYAVAKSNVTTEISFDLGENDIYNANAINNAFMVFEERLQALEGDYAQAISLIGGAE